MSTARALPMPDSKAARWWVFTRERFEPVSHLLMVALFFVAHLAVASRLTGSAIRFGGREALLFVGALAFFFKLRLYDEIKDYEVDLRINPTRPLARGLLVHEDLYRGIVACIAIELVAFLAAGIPALLSILVAIGYSLLMYKEFFVGALLRPHLTTYALTHTVVSSFLSLAVFAALVGEPSWRLPETCFFYALTNWCLFNIFEFGRKTFASAEERPGVASYSNIFGRWGAVALVLANAAIASFAPIRLAGDAPIARVALWATFLAMLAVGAVYAATDRGGPAKAYRGFSSAYIILVYVQVVVLIAGGLV